MYRVTDIALEYRAWHRDISLKGRLLKDRKTRFITTGDSFSGKKTILDDVEFTSTTNFILTLAD